MLSFTVSVPGRVVSFSRLPSAQRSEIYKGWLNSAKEEARHYWVRTPPGFRGLKTKLRTPLAPAQCCADVAVTGILYIGVPHSRVVRG